MARPSPTALSAGRSRGGYASRGHAGYRGGYRGGYYGRRHHGGGRYYYLSGVPYFYPSYGFGLGFGYPSYYYGSSGFYDPAFDGYYGGGYYDGPAYRPYEGRIVQETAPGDLRGHSKSGGSARSLTGAVQRQLAERGYYKGSIDGQFGQASQGAMRRFQHAKGLKETGLIDEASLRALGFDPREQE